MFVVVFANFVACHFTGFREHPDIKPEIETDQDLERRNNETVVPPVNCSKYSKGMAYNWDHDECYTKIGENCMAEKGEKCGPHSYCNKTGQCQCQKNYVPLPDNSGCDSNYTVKFYWLSTECCRYCRPRMGSPYNFSCRKGYYKNQSQHFPGTANFKLLIIFATLVFVIQLVTQQ